LATAKQLNVLDIYLDLENPRHVEMKNQAEVIEYLVRSEKVKELAKDIAENSLSPLDNIAVMRDSGNKYVVLEGNRRICALTLLNDPEKSPSGEYRYFKRLADKSKLFPKKIECHVFDSREDSDLWIERRHEGLQDGIGTKKWNAEQKTRHNERLNKSDRNSLSLAILDYSVEKGFISDSGKNGVLTTASRFLVNPFLRQTMGIVSKSTDRDVVINVPIDQFNIVVKRFCDDLLDERSIVNSRANKEILLSYAKTLISQSIAPTDRVARRHLEEAKYARQSSGSDVSRESSSSSESGVESSSSLSFNDPISGVPGSQNLSEPTEPTEPINVVSSQTTHEEEVEESASQSSSGPNSEGNDKKPGQRRNPDQRNYVVPHDFRPRIDSPHLRRVFNEMKTIRAEDQPLAVSLLTRAFLENIYEAFFEDVMREKSSSVGKKHVLIDKIVQYLQKNKSDFKQPRLSALQELKRIASDEKHLLSPLTLGLNAHAKIYPDHIRLKQAWDNIQEIIDYMLSEISKK